MKRKFNSKSKRAQKRLAALILLAFFLPFPAAGLSARHAALFPGGCDCHAIIGRLTYEDRLPGGELSPQLPELRAGDILLTFSTHTLGWRHGHCALALGGDRAIESLCLGEPAQLTQAESWRRYTSLAILRVKAPQGEGELVAAFAQEQLSGLPYSLTAGLYGDGTQCADLVRRAWQALGVELCPEAHWPTSPRDIYKSPLVEVVYSFGMEAQSSARNRAIASCKFIKCCI